MLLCKLGLHKWVPWGDPSYSLIDWRHCKRCGKAVERPFCFPRSKAVWKVDLADAIAKAKQEQIETATTLLYVLVKQCETLGGDAHVADLDLTRAKKALDIHQNGLMSEADAWAQLGNWPWPLDGLTQIRATLMVAHDRKLYPAKESKHETETAPTSSRDRRGDSTTEGEPQG